MHFSLWDKDGGENLFKDPDGDQGLSELAYHFLGGVIHSAEALCAITNPTVNSYKRINAPVTASGATWAPNYISYSGNNRTHMVRTPEDDRFEFRLPDGAANPYLLQAAVLAAGLDGIANKRDPGERLDVDMNAPGVDLTGLRQLPLYLLDALRAFERSDVLTHGAGRRVCHQLRQTQDGRMAGIFQPAYDVGARAHARLLKGASPDASWTNHVVRIP